MSKSGITDNNTEILDLIDETDTVIGQLSKKAIHEGKNLLHREISVLIKDSSGNLLLQQRSYKKVYSPGKWTPSALGHVLSGQSPADAAHMELKEELGFDTDLVLVEKRKCILGDHSSLGFIYIGEFPKGQMISPDRDEVEKAEFFTTAEITKMIASGSIDGLSAETLQKYISGYYKINL